MASRALSSLGIVTLLATGATGCGIVSKDLEGEVRFSFEVDGDEGAPEYDEIVTFDPNSNEDVKNNRDKVEAGQVVQIALELTEVDATNKAKIVAGQVFVKPTTAGDDQWLQAVGQWSGIPLYDDVGNPAIGQVFVLEIPLATQARLSELVFENRDSIDFKIQGIGYDDYLQPASPTRLKGEVNVKLDFTVSVP
ncbi:hypothetical protein L6R52_15350 [Myxococcota bacterium]|nr:hypothetical protein [Myxococcota bacterium]